MGSVLFQLHLKDVVAACVGAVRCPPFQVIVKEGLDTLKLLCERGLRPAPVGGTLEAVALRLSVEREDQSPA